MGDSVLRLFYFTMNINTSELPVCLFFDLRLVLLIECHKGWRILTNTRVFWTTLALQTHKNVQNNTDQQLTSWVYTLILGPWITLFEAEQAVQILYNVLMSMTSNISYQNVKVCLCFSWAIEWTYLLRHKRKYNVTLCKAWSGKRPLQLVIPPLKRWFTSRTGCTKVTSAGGGGGGWVWEKDRNNFLSNLLFKSLKSNKPIGTKKYHSCLGQQKKYSREDWYGYHGNQSNDEQPPRHHEVTPGNKNLEMGGCVSSGRKCMETKCSGF